MCRTLIMSGMITLLTGGLATITVVRADACQGKESKKADDGKESSKKADEREAEKTADRILKETDDPLLVNRWYDQVLPALKRKYKKVVSRATYDAWRRRYFEDEVTPKIISLGYDLTTAKEAFMERTERQTAR